jgi:hypothetical protein
MKYHTVQLPDLAYQLLLQRADALHLTPEEALIHLLADQPGMPDVAEAQAAVERLTNLFADVDFSDFDSFADDPQIALANRELIDSRS